MRTHPSVAFDRQIAEYAAARARIHARSRRGGIRSEPDAHEQARVSHNNETIAIREWRRLRNAECRISRAINRRWTLAEVSP